MNLTRLNVALLVAVLLLSAWEWTRPGNVGPSREIGDLFPAYHSDLAARVELEGPDGATALERVEGEWTCADRYGYPASEGHCARLLNALASLTTFDLMTEDPARHDEYGLDEGTTRVRVLDAEGRVLADLLQGDDVSGQRASYVRRFGGDPVYRAAALTRIPAEPTFWLEPRWMPFEPAIVTTVRLGGPEVGEPRRLDREGKTHRWTIEGEQVAPRRVKGLLEALSTLFLEDVVAPRGDVEALGEVALRVEVDLLDGRTLVGELAAEEDGSRRAMRGPEDWVVRLPGRAVETVLERARGL